MAIRIVRRFRDLLDVTFGSPSDGDVVTYDSGTDKLVLAAGGAGGGAPTDADYLVGTANGSLSAEIVVGTSPGGELGGTWASPTVDATHSGSSHASVQAAAEATAAAALSAHATDTTGIHGIADTAALLDTGDIGSTVQAFDADLSTWAGLTPSANAQSLVTAANYAAMRGLLDLEPGTDFPALTTFEDHSARHENGGGDEISVAGLSGTLADAQPVAVRDAGVAVGTRAALNFIEGSNVTITLADDAGNGEVDITIAASGSGSTTADDENLILHMAVYA